MSVNVDATGYEPGKPVFLTIDIPAGPNGCKGRYTIEVFQRGRMIREIRGLNYDPGSPENDTHVLLSADEALPTGGVVRLAIFLQQASAPKFGFTVRAQQGKKLIGKIEEQGAFVAGSVSVREYDLFLA